ncbi:PspC domain-containing protein [Blastococcus saxobsidens]|uniref:Putative stress-responsive transcriptional regulator n=1 Tax=Blastococcus saxobsidens (strain DD2) TaxID=1146883 RepID=H6RTK2_BLASD|nr:PspC domain-containing protein [Blastococcus saxobsidens]CCG01860.1 putative stress-responsive transcriptional regulator [Blastococcus saxobsidens DD2]
MTNPLPPTAPSDPQQTPGRPRLRRSSTDRMAGGVCGGLADHSGIDAVLWRVGFVGLTVAGGAGILIYLLLWVLVPPAPSGSDEPLSPLEQLVRRLHEALTGGRAR